MKNEVETDEISEMDTTEIREAQVRQALRQAMSGRTPGIDGIPAEVYKADSDVAVKELTRLFNRLWQEEKVADRLDSENTKTRGFERVQELVWCDIVTCTSKVMGRVIIERIQSGVDHVLRKNKLDFK